MPKSLIQNGFYTGQIIATLVYEPILDPSQGIEYCQSNIDLENLLKERGISKNKVCENCRLQRTQLNNYCQNKVSRIDLNTLEKLCEYPAVCSRSAIADAH